MSTVRDHNYYKPWAKAGPSRTPAADEASFLNIWQTQYEQYSNDLLRLALCAGMTTDRLAWVFVTGYQSACRHAFPSVHTQGLLAFAVSEDRSQENPLPGVCLSTEENVQRLKGSKTWVAAADTVETLLIKAGRGMDASYWAVPRQSDGLRIESPNPASFLRDLSQGRAHFTDVEVGEDQRLDASRVSQFSLLEPLYLYAAFCGHVLGATRDGDLRVCAYDCLDAIDPALASLDAGGLDVANVQKADARAQDLLVRLSGNRLAAAGNWEEDQRLIAMYSKGIRRLDA